MPTAVVTGGAGFLGSHLCDRLISRGFRVICVDNLDTGSLQNVEHLRGDDFLFVNQRGSHEKMTWTLVLALLFALAASLRARRLGEVGPLVVVFYLCGFAVI